MDIKHTVKYFTVDLCREVLSPTTSDSTHIIVLMVKILQ